jgi:putative hydrolase of the HAD superfamily
MDIFRARQSVKCEEQNLYLRRRTVHKYPSAILFDLDDTLISFDGASENAWDKCSGEFVLKYSCNFTKAELLSTLKKVRKWYWSNPERHKTGRENIIGARRDIVKKALSEHGICDIKISNEFADYYSMCQNELICLFPNTISTLTALQSGNVRMGLITNGSSTGQRAKLSRFGLERFFEIILIDQEIGYGKPDIRIYERALNLLSLNTGDVWMVGDNLIWDIQAPQSIGMYAIWNDYKKLGLSKDTSITPDRIISEVSELLITAV